MRILDVADAVAPGCRVAEIGIRPGEKLHEVLISEDEARHTLELDDMFVVQPTHPWWSSESWTGGRALPEGFLYSSDRNDRWLAADELRALVERLEGEA